MPLKQEPIILDAPIPEEDAEQALATVLSLMQDIALLEAELKDARRVLGEVLERQPGKKIVLEGAGEAALQKQERVTFDHDALALELSEKEWRAVTAEVVRTEPLKRLMKKKPLKGAMLVKEERLVVTKAKPKVDLR